MRFKIQISLLSVEANVLVNPRHLGVFLWPSLEVNKDEAAPAPSAADHPSRDSKDLKPHDSTTPVSLNIPALCSAAYGDLISQAAMWAVRRMPRRKRR